MLGEHAFTVEQVFLLMEAVWLMHNTRKSGDRGGKGAETMFDVSVFLILP